tara:strand:- start:98374 stop:99168 length:795 start_codon:yes stop_codon:yes gene_type:complete
LSIESFFNNEWTEYSRVTPLAKRIHHLLTDLGEVVSNDHIALRTIAHPGIGLEAFEDFFKEFGYQACGEYFFEDKRLRAIHLEAKNQPLIFISEFLYEDDHFSTFLQETIEDMIAACDGATISELFSKRIYWQPSFSIYQKLAKESEYAAWLYAWGFRTNHFTVSVNQLKAINTIEKVNQLLKKNNFLLNASGGEIKGHASQGLVQSSTMADKFSVQFMEGQKEVPSCYYEFAQRFEVDGKLYTGFVPSSADKIFESTDRIKSE